MVYPKKIENSVPGGTKTYSSFIKTIKGDELSKKEQYHPQLNPREIENVKNYIDFENTRKVTRNVELIVNTGGSSGQFKKRLYQKE